MKKFIKISLVVVFGFGLLEATNFTFICKVNTKNCSNSKRLEASNKEEAKQKVFEIFKKNCKDLNISQIYCYTTRGGAPKKRVTNDIIFTKTRVNAKEAFVAPLPPKTSKYLFDKQEDLSAEEYSFIDESGFKDPLQSPLSTFSIDVDTASYAIIRRYLMLNNLFPPKGAVRIEEMINYFHYDYKYPEEKPIKINLRFGENIWNKNNKVLHIGLQAKKIKKFPPSNLVFLIDVSGSMQSKNKLPLLKRAFKLLVSQLRAKDTVSIVVYAGTSGLVLNGARGDQKEKIIKAIDSLRAGGSTAGGEGIKLAYKIARENFIKGGNNRVILATDGDFNVGVRSESELIDLIEKEKKDGIFLSVLGFGSGNYKDSRMEKLADKGDGNYAYIDNLLEAKKVLVKQMGATLFSVAKDVKIQVEFNPALVKKYRLVGYENRKMANEDFSNDKKDAGEIGAGDQVSALYEIKLREKNATIKSPLKYQTPQLKKTQELATIKIRYKDVNASKSKLLEKVVTLKSNEIKDEDFFFAQDVASFGMILRDSKYKGNITLKEVLEIAKKYKGKDPEGYRADFIKLVEKALLLKETK